MYRGRRGPRKLSRCADAQVAGEVRTDQQAQRSSLAHEYVAEQLRREIALGLFTDRGSLPPVRELASVFGGGVMTVHRAIAILESQALVTSKRGRGGGTFVIAETGDDEGMRQLRARGRRERRMLEEALECRLELEPQAAAWAARRRSVADLTSLREVLDQAAATHDGVEFTQLDGRFHIGIVQAARNRFIEQALEQVRAELYFAAELLPSTPMWRQRSQAGHEEIFAAVKVADVERAAQLTARHIRYSVTSVRALLCSL
jgi:GntR family transcriptional regulator, transcriptional repressor for pyruvate dehydrogenase complex